MQNYRIYDYEGNFVGHVINMHDYNEASKALEDYLKKYKNIYTGDPYTLVLIEDTELTNVFIV